MNTYKKIIDRKGYVWMIGSECTSDAIFVQSRDGLGFSGRSLEFLLEDGTSCTLKGPIHSNPEDLYRATGFDLRDQHSTMVKISSEVVFNYGQSEMLDILYEDKNFLVGPLDRGEKLAQELANNLDKQLFLQVTSKGGMYLKTINPTNE